MPRKKQKVETPSKKLHKTDQYRINKFLKQQKEVKSCEEDDFSKWTKQV